ncbi:MAG TPA: bifunctional riboflavin kinase/FAD synthetase [Chloroflexota bacterium]|nr:bifunctional riboflavin kinase/FAD synthetase [Chloroflexota bacterium]
MSAGLTRFEEGLKAAGITGPTAVAIGTFDGVHLGHQHLIGILVERARELGATPLVLTFQPRPAEVLRPELPPRYLTTLADRERFLREAGAAKVVVLPFTRELSQTSAADFARALATQLRMRALLGGPDLALGRGREGTPEVLRGLGQHLGFTVELVPGMSADGESVRSSVIHRLLEEGNVERVERLLGRPHAAVGHVVHGEGRGRTIGVPTANVAVPEGLALPANGVYAVQVEVNGHRYGGAANLGIRPTFNGQTRSLEVHLFDFSGDVYGQPVRVEFIARLRPEKRFSGVNELVQQIQEDLRRARGILG